MDNEGGRPFLYPGKVPGYEDVFADVDRINPKYFDYLDRKIDYLNDQCDVDVQSRVPGAPPDVLVRRLATRFAEEAWRLRQSRLRPARAWHRRAGSASRRVPGRPHNSAAPP